MRPISTLARAVLGACLFAASAVSATDPGGKGTCSLAQAILEVDVPAGNTAALRNAWECAHNRRQGELLTINLLGDITLQRVGETYPFYAIYGLVLRSDSGRLLVRKGPGVSADRVAIQRVPVGYSVSDMPAQITKGSSFGIISIGHSSGNMVTNGAELTLEYIELKWGYVDHANSAGGLYCAHAICRESRTFARRLKSIEQMTNHNARQACVTLYCWRIRRLFGNTGLGTFTWRVMGQRRARWS